MTKTRDKQIEADVPFQASIAAMQMAEGYLGSTRMVEGLLRVMVSDWTDALSVGGTEEMARKLAQDYSAILIGESEGYGKVPGWNQPGGIDLFVASQLGLPERGRDAIEHALVLMLTQATNICNYADEPGVLTEHWQWQVDAMFEEYVNLFLGIPGEDPDAADPESAQSPAGNGAVKESLALVPSVEQLAAKLSELSDGLISVAYDQANGLLIGNFGDWADGDVFDKFDAVAAEYNLKPVHEDELGDVVEAYPGSVEVDLEAPLTHTQESVKRWSGYP